MVERFTAGRDREIQIVFDGMPIACHRGESIASALVAAGRDAIRASARMGEARGIFCNMGICYECLVYVEGRAVRSCMTQVEEGMRVMSWAPKEADPS